MYNTKFVGLGDPNDGTRETGVTHGFSKCLNDNSCFAGAGRQRQKGTLWCGPTKELDDPVSDDLLEVMKGFEIDRPVDIQCRIPACCLEPGKLGGKPISSTNS
jgi:hypothetical protein